MANRLKGPKGETGISFGGFEVIQVKDNGNLDQVVAMRLENMVGLKTYHILDVKWEDKRIRMTPGF